MKIPNKSLKRQAENSRFQSLLKSKNHVKVKSENQTQQDESKEVFASTEMDRRDYPENSFSVLRLVIKLLFYLTMIAMSYHEIQLIHLHKSLP